MDLLPVGRSFQQEARFEPACLIGLGTVPTTRQAWSGGMQPLRAGKARGFSDSPAWEVCSARAAARTAAATSRRWSAGRRRADAPGASDPVPTGGEVRRRKAAAVADIATAAALAPGHAASRRTASAARFRRGALPMMPCRPCHRAVATSNLPAAGPAPRSGSRPCRAVPGRPAPECSRSSPRPPPRPRRGSRPRTARGLCPSP